MATSLHRLDAARQNWGWERTLEGCRRRRRNGERCNAARCIAASLARACLGRARGGHGDWPARRVAAGAPMGPAGLRGPRGGPA
eukprot:7408907-Pyramimonas_sp.AAC.1